MVAMSASCGTLVSTSRSSVSMPAAISGRAAFLAPPIAMSPSSGRAAADADAVHAGAPYIRGSATPRWCMYFPALSA